MIDDGTVLRENPDGSMTSFGPFRYPLIDGPYEATYATDRDGSLYATFGTRGLQVVPLNGAATTHWFSPPPGTGRCWYTEMSVADSGAVYLRDLGCRRVLMVGPDGSVSQPLSEAVARDASIDAIAADSAGALWFSESSRRGSGIGRLSQDGSVVRYATRSEAGSLVPAEGGVWAAGDCSILRLVGDRLTETRVGIPVWHVAPAPDGRIAVGGGSWVVIGRAGAFPTSERRCDERDPTLRAVGRERSARRLRTGRPLVTLVADEPVFISADVQILAARGERTLARFSAERAVPRRRGRAAMAVRVPSRYRRSLARWARQGAVVQISALATDRSGNQAFLPNFPIVVRLRG